MDDSTQLRIRVAELCGWTNIKPNGLGSGLCPWVGNPPFDCIWGDWAKLPDYPNDLNACHKFEETLTEKQKEGYARRLSCECDPKRVGFDWWAVFATAEQRCRAFVATMEQPK